MTEAKVRMDEELLKEIEKKLKIKLHDWQRAYLLKNEVVLELGTFGRGTGKTLAQIIELLFESEEPLNLITFKQKIEISDHMTVNGDINHYQTRKYVKNIYMPMLIAVHKKLKKLNPRQLVLIEKVEE